MVGNGDKMTALKNSPIVWGGKLSYIQDKLNERLAAFGLTCYEFKMGDDYYLDIRETGSIYSDERTRIGGEPCEAYAYMLAMINAFDIAAANKMENK